MYVVSYAWFLAHDLQKLRFVYWSTDVSPLGSGALAGSPFAIDREKLASDMEFGRVSENSLMAVADRDFVGMYSHHFLLTSP